jgi:hypothetical protein
MAVAELDDRTLLVDFERATAEGESVRRGEVPSKAARKLRSEAMKAFNRRTGKMTLLANQLVRRNRRPK